MEHQTTTPELCTENPQTQPFARVNRVLFARDDSFLVRTSRLILGSHAPNTAPRMPFVVPTTGGDAVETTPDFHALRVAQRTGVRANFQERVLY